MKSTLLAIAMMLTGTTATHAFSLRCLGSSTCIATQGTHIPADEVIEMLEFCNDFTRGNVGARVLKLSVSEILKIGNGNVNHPVSQASYAFDRLYDGPLEFDRSERDSSTKYLSIRRSCGRLHQDFNDQSQRSR